MKKKEKTFTFTKSVRVWLAVISVVNVGDSFQFFVNYSLLSTQIYTLSPQYGKGKLKRTFNCLTGYCKITMRIKKTRGTYF